MSAEQMQLLEETDPDVMSTYIYYTVLLMCKFMTNFLLMAFTRVKNKVCVRAFVCACMCASVCVRAPACIRLCVRSCVHTWALKRKELQYNSGDRL